MTNKYWGGLFILLTYMAPSSNAQPCKEIADESHYSSQTAYISTTGKSCLTRDITQGRVFDIHAGSFKSLTGRSLLNISYSDTFVDRSVGKLLPTPPLTAESVFDIDLQGHTVRSTVEDLRGLWERFADAQVKIQNGKIVVPGTRNVGVDLGNYSGALNVTKVGTLSPHAAHSEFEDIPASETLDKNPPVYKPSKFEVKNMTIRAGWRGVVMGGGNNVLRNSTIEVDGHTAVYLYGPGSVIENNTIIIHGQGEAKPFDAAIKLRDAHGAVVRNNRIIYKGGWFAKNAPAAINLLDSKDVLIDGNTVENFDVLVRKNGETQFSEQNNVLK